MPLPALKSLAKKAKKSPSDAERYWKEAESCDKLPGSRKYKCKMATVKKRLGLENFNPDLKYHLISGWEKNDGMIGEEWYGAVERDDAKYLVVLDGFAARGASINHMGTTTMCECALMEAYFEDVFAFNQTKSNGEEVIFTAEDGELVIKKDGSVECRKDGKTRVADFKVQFPVTGTLSQEDEWKIMDWKESEAKTEEVSTGGIADVMAGQPKIEAESYNDNYNRGMDHKLRTREADGSNPARNEWVHTATGKTGIFESKNDKYMSIKTDVGMVVDFIEEFREVGPEPVLEELMNELKLRDFVVERRGNKLIVSKGMFRAGELCVVEDKVIYEMKGLMPKIFVYAPEKLITIIDSIFGKNDDIR